jgi:hypothetical protein
MFELLFLLSFTLHNIEEALWLPEWSKYAGKYHPEVQKNEFHFADFVITIIGYLITFLYLAFGEYSEIIKYLYFGFLLMMCFNALFPHLAATIVLKKYAPGTMTGLLLNLPIGLYIIFCRNANLNTYKLIIGAVAFSVFSLLLLRLLFKLGKKLIKEY